MCHKWVARKRKLWVVGSNPIKDSLGKKRYTHCLKLVGSRNGFDRDFPIELKQGIYLRLTCQKRALVKYRQYPKNKQM